MAKLNPAQQEQLVNIGAYLKSVRENQGKDVDEVANQIFIRPAIVRAIETADWESLPEPVFVQGFIRRYGDYLGLDGKELSQQFESTPVSVLPDPKLASQGVEGVVNKQDRYRLKVLSAGETAGQNLPSQGEASSLKWGLLVAAIAILAGGGLWFFSRRMPQTALPDSSPSPTAAETGSAESGASEVPGEAATPETDAPAAEATDSGPVAESAPTGAPITFQVNLAGDSWMRVIVDGEEVYEGILTEGATETWQAERELTVRAGNSGAVLYSFNGGDELPLGAPGAVSGLTLTPETDPQALPPQ